MLSTDMGNKSCLRELDMMGGGRAICLHECLQSVLSVRMILPENLDFIN